MWNEKVLKGKDVWERFVYTIEIALFLLVVIYNHLGLPIVHDDATRSNMFFNNIFEIIKYYWDFNGRLTTDSLAVILAQHFHIWTIIDCLAYIMLLVLLIKIFECNSTVFVGCTMILILVFPFNYWESAGYVSTTTNYLYCTVGFLGIIYLVKSIMKGKRLGVSYGMAALCTIYIAFSNQFIIGEILFLAYVVGYQLWINKKRVQNVKGIIALGIFAIIMFGVMWMSPGYQDRLHGTREMMYWLPQYQNWSFFKKAIEGYTTTVANVVFNDNQFLLVLCVALMILGLYSGKNNITKFIATVPVLCMALLKTKGYDNFIVYYKYAVGKPDIRVKLSSLKSVVALGFPILIMLSIFIIMTVVIEDKWTKTLAISMLVIGAASREMMGFTPTIYASDFRTFTMFFFCIIIAILCVLKELIRKKEDKGTLAVAIAALMCWLF